jgi:hypothetical protein
MRMSYFQKKKKKSNLNVNHVILPLTYKIFSSPFLSMYYQGKKKKIFLKTHFFSIPNSFPMYVYSGPPRL